MVSLHDGTSRQKPETKAKAYSGIDVFGAGHAFINQSKGFSRQGVLHAVGQKTGFVFAHQHGHAATGPHEVAQVLGLLRVGLRTKHHFDQGHQVRGHEKVQAQHAFGRGQTLRDGTDRKAGAVAAQQGERIGQLGQSGKQGLLEGQLFGNAFHQKTNTGPGHVGQIGHGLHAVGAVGHTEVFQVAADMRTQGLAFGGIGFDHAHLTATTGEHYGNVHAHGAASDDHGAGLKRV